MKNHTQALPTQPLNWLSRLLNTITLDKLYQIKEGLFNSLGVDRFLKRLLAFGVTPNILTVISLGFGLVAAYFAIEDQAIFAFCVSNRLFLDNLDGYFARRFDLQTKLGDRLDHWGDLSIGAAILLSSVLFSAEQLLSAIALVTYLGEFVLLKVNNLLEKKFPSTLFVLFFAFGAYRMGLLIQIVYQIGSYLYFHLFMRKKLS